MERDEDDDAQTMRYVGTSESDDMHAMCCKEHWITGIMIIIIYALSACLIHVLQHAYMSICICMYVYVCMCM